MKPIIVFEHKFEMHINPLSRDTKQAVRYKNKELRRDWGSRCKFGGSSSHRICLKS